MATKDAIIKKVYYDSGALGSIKRTLKEAREIDPSIKEKDVKSWKDRNIQRKINLRGYNSFIASEGKEEYQMDLFEMPVPRVVDARKLTPEQRAARKQQMDEERNVRRRVKTNRRAGEGGRTGPKPKPIVVQKIPRNAPRRYGLLLVDIFTKFVDVVPMVDNRAPTVITALKKAIANMGGRPQTIFSDGEGALSTIDLKKYLETERIRLLQTRSHAAYAERHIRTIKDMLFKRLEFKKLEPAKWVDLLPEVLKQYNEKMVHSAHDLTPSQAKLSRNEALVKGGLEVKRITTRKYPPVSVGDTVKVFQKKDKLDKERVSTWRNENYKIERIDESHGQKFYVVNPKVPQWNRPLVRSEILFVK